jgi:hypothetical protein
VKDTIFAVAKEFSASSHGSSSYDTELLYVMGDSENEFVPFSYLVKKIPSISNMRDLQKNGFSYSSAGFLELESFTEWYKKQFGKKFTQKHYSQIGILHFPREAKILSIVSEVSKCYEELKNEHVINNGKNLPVQLAEWYSKLIFGLKQVKSSSQRGFDFYSDDGRKIEVMVDWNDRSSPKGAKLKKALVEISDCCIIIYINSKFLIRDILFLDSDFIMRKYSDKGHTIFLKDNVVSEYFFSVSSKHHDKIISKDTLLNFSAPTLKSKLEARF